MDEQQFFEIVKAGKFFTKYCPHVTNHNHKRRKLDGNKRPIDFTTEDREAMKKAAGKLADDLKKMKL